MPAMPGAISSPAELEATAPVPPPGALWPAIQTGAFGPPLPLWRRLNLGTAVVGGALAAGLAFAALQFGWVAPGPDPMTARLNSPAAGEVAQVTFDPDSGALTARLLSPDPAPGRARELWLIAGETAPISLGVLPPGGVVSLALPVALHDRLDGAVLAISDEPSGGSPSGQPSGAVLASGALSAS